MPTIQKPALRDLYTSLVHQTNAHTAPDANTAVLDRIVSIVGDRAGIFGSTTTDAIAKELGKGNHTREQKLAIAKRGLDSTEKADLETLLQDAAFTERLDASTLNFLKAVVGLEPLSKIDAMDRSGTPQVAADPNSPEVQAAHKLRDLVKTGELKKYYDAVIGAVDNPALKAEAEALFAQLPVVKPNMGAQDFVKAGLWTVAPRGIEEMQKSARYLPGRQVMVETHVHAAVPSRIAPDYDIERRKVGTYNKDGPMAVTYRATLVGDDPANANNFLVKVDGADTPVSVTKASVFKHNHPHELDREFIQSDTMRTLPWWGRHGTWELDYTSPLAKAKLCEIAVKLDEHVAKLDFTKVKAETDGRLAVHNRGIGGEKTVDIQKKCVELVFRSIDMRYPRDDHAPHTDAGRAPDGNRDVARQAIRGTGMCVQQSVVFGGLLMPFMDILGVDGQYRSGNCFRNIKDATKNVFAPDYKSGHGWWQLTFRPSMEMTVTDRTWDQVNLALDRAYGFPYGDRYAYENLTGYSPRKVSATDVNVSGDVTVASVERQFSHAGDGRENHISRLNRDG